MAEFYRQEEGCVLSSAIDKAIFVIVKRRFDRKIRLGYTRTELVDQVQELQHELVREALLVSGVNSQIEIGTLGDIPSTGSGLGSSSTVAVGVLNALYAYLNEPKTQEELARLACDIEINRLGKPIGKQDQYIVAYGGIRFIRFQCDEKVVVEKVEISDSERRRFNQLLMLFYTNQSRNSESILKEQKQGMHRRSDELRELKSMAHRGRSLLENGDFDSFGMLMDDAWKLKKTLAPRISNRQIDDIYAAAKKAGALGGKIAGAGGGGFLLLYCPRERQYEVRDALNGLVELPFHLEEHGSKVIFNYHRE